MGGSSSGGRGGSGGRDTGVGSGSTMIHPIRAIIKFSTALVDVNCLQSKGSDYMDLRLKILDLIR